MVDDFGLLALVLVAIGVAIELVAGIGVLVESLVASSWWRCSWSGAWAGRAGPR